MTSKNPPQEQSISISINSIELVKFCDKLMKRSRDINKTHDSLITLESFISVFARDSHGTEAYEQISSTLSTITEKSRQELLEKSTEELIIALSQCNASFLAAIHTPLSRNGFYEILKSAITELSDDDIALVMLWSANWIKEAKQLATDASEYPDVMDFKTAGISIEEFQAMSDIDRVLNG